MTKSSQSQAFCACMSSEVDDKGSLKPTTNVILPNLDAFDILAESTSQTSVATLMQEPIRRGLKSEMRLKDGSRVCVLAAPSCSSKRLNNI